MPYKSLDEANPAIKGIKPKVTLEQANLIASWADKIGKAGNADNPWPVAMASFKKAYTVRGGKWVKRNNAEVAAADDDPELETVGETYRPRKTEKSLHELKELRREAHELLQAVNSIKVHENASGDQGSGDQGDDGEWQDEDYEMPAPLKGTISYKDLEDKQNADAGQEEMKKAIYFFPQLASEVMRCADSDDAAKLKNLEALAAEFIAKAKKTLSGKSGGATSDTASAHTDAHSSDTPSADATEQDMTEPSNFAESFEGATALDLTDVEVAESGQSKPLTLKVQLIQPGWGNKADNYYYPVDMLRMYAEKFIGAKMYESNHNPSDKSTRTWVSTVTELAGFTDTGAPIAKVVVHDPSFAERCKNLSSAGLLSRMECSILASGKAPTQYSEGDRKGLRVDEITAVEAVDWVTKAGAGGHASELSESAKPAVGSDAPTADTMKGVKTVANITLEAKKQLIEASKLPEAAQKKLLLAEYETDTKLTEVIDSERAYLQELTGSGQPFGNPPTTTQDEKIVEVSEEDRGKSQDEVIARYFK